MVPAQVRSSGRVQEMPHPEVPSNGSPCVSVCLPHCPRLPRELIAHGRDLPLKYGDVTLGRVNSLSFVFKFTRHATIHLFRMRSLLLYAELG